MSTLDEAIQLIRMGNQEEGRQILEGLLEEDEANEQVWLWLSAVVDNDEDREVCLDNVLALDPDNGVAKRGLEALRAGTFNVNDLLADALGEGVEEEAEEPVTFIDDFVVSDDDEDDDFGFGDDDDDDEPSTKKKGGLNVRFIVLAVLVLVLVIVLGALAFASLSLMGGDDGGDTPPADNTPAQETPGEEQQPEVEPTPEDTPTPSPTDTPTLTPTSSLQLPTVEPTPEPSPTATTVVSPTPAN